MPGMDAFFRDLDTVAHLPHNRALSAELEHQAQTLVGVMQDKLGHYQPSVGPFAAWATLQPATQAARQAAGYTPDDPELASGQMHNDLTYTMDADGLGVTVGIPKNAPSSAYALDQELGTVDMPPRAFVGPAFYQQKDEIAAALGHTTVKAIGGPVS